MSNIFNEILKDKNFYGFIEAQNNFHRYKITRHCFEHLNKYMTPTSNPEAEIYFELLIREIESHNEKSEGFVNWSEFCHKSAGLDYDFNGDRNFGFRYITTSFILLSPIASEGLRGYMKLIDIITH